MKNAKYYLGIIFVILIWGISPNITNYLLNYYSPAAQSSIGSVVSITSMLFICRKKLKNLNGDYFKVAVPTGIFYSLAILSQKIGLVYTTPTQLAFLENISCVATPVLMLIVAKQKLSFTKLFSGGLCLFGIYILCGGAQGGSMFGFGEFLCGLAGILYSFNIVGTAVYAKKLDVTLYLLIQFTVHGIISFLYLFIAKGDIAFSFNVIHISIIVATSLVSIVLGWIIRTICLKHLDPTFVSIAMPFSAAITGVVSVMTGTDALSLSLVAGSVIILAAIIISGLYDARLKTNNCG